MNEEKTTSTPPEGVGQENTPGTGTEVKTSSTVENKTPKTGKKEPKGTDAFKPPTNKKKPRPKKPKKEPPPEPEAEKDIVQVLVKVTPHIKDKAKQEAELAYMYGWITEPTVTALFTWVVDTYLDAGIKQYISQRRGEQPVETEGKDDTSQGG